jgi:hypothetical protein
MEACACLPFGWHVNIGAELYAEQEHNPAKNRCCYIRNCGKTSQLCRFYARNFAKMKKACISKPFSVSRDQPRVG